MSGKCSSFKTISIEPGIALRVYCALEATETPPRAPCYRAGNPLLLSVTYLMPIFDPPNLTRLLGSIEAGHLVVLCGAGLSISPPSNLMSALRVARACYDKWQPTEVLPATLRDDIDGLAGHFHAQGTLKSVFITTLVPWDDLVGEPNEGHAAVADFLICGAARAALSANFDGLIEQWSNRRKVAMRGALDGTEAVQFTRTRPLLKFHGCFHRQPEETLWTQGQLQEPLIQGRVQSCSAWMKINLPAKDLLIVGLWTDWGYLNDVLANAIAVQGFNSVTVVDPATTADLQQKAPALWNKLSGGTVSFTPIQASGADALEELRTEFSKVWAKKFFQLWGTLRRRCWRGLRPHHRSAGQLEWRGALQSPPRRRRHAVQPGSRTKRAGGRSRKRRLCAYSSERGRSRARRFLRSTPGVLHPDHTWRRTNPGIRARAVQRASERRLGGHRGLCRRRFPGYPGNRYFRRARC